VVVAATSFFWLTTLTNAVYCCPWGLECSGRLRWRRPACAPSSTDGRNRTAKSRVARPGPTNHPAVAEEQADHRSHLDLVLVGGERRRQARAITSGPAPGRVAINRSPARTRPQRRSTNAIRPVTRDVHQGMTEAGELRLCSSRSAPVAARQQPRLRLTPEARARRAKTAQSCGRAGTNCQVTLGIRTPGVCRPTRRSRSLLPIGWFGLVSSRRPARVAAR